LFDSWKSETPHQKKIWIIAGAGAVISVAGSWFGLPLMLYAMYLHMAYDKDGKRQKK
jgi:hypothetical protein